MYTQGICHKKVFCLVERVAEQNVLMCVTADIWGYNVNIIYLLLLCSFLKSENILHFF